MTIIIQYNHKSINYLFLFVIGTFLKLYKSYTYKYLKKLVWFLIEFFLILKLIEKIMLKYIIISLIIIFNFYYYSYSESIIEKVEINPLNRTLIYLSDKPESYIAELSPSKEKIILRLDNTKTRNNINITGSTGIIKNITVNSFKSFSEVLVELSNKRGFTLNYLPYSKSIMLEVFDWNKLNKEEDFYRLGLLSYNDGLFNEAEQYFKKSASKDIPNAYFFLGLINLSKGKNNEACDYFLLAEKYNCNISDNFAGLSEAYRLLKDTKNSIAYKNKFQKHSGMAEIEPMVYSETIFVNESLENLEPSFLSSDFIEAKENSDSSKVINISSSDTIKKSTQPVIIETPIINQRNNQNANELPDWLTNGILYIFLVLTLLLTLVFSLYRKWRNEQLLQQKKKNNQKFKENLENARKNIANSKQMANIYQKYDKTSKQEQNESKDNKENLQKTNQKENNSQKINEIELLAKSIISEKIKNQISTEESKANSNKTPDTSTLLKKLNPNLELALHLQNQNIQQKHKKLNDIEFDSSDNSDNLSDFAKKIGIDTGSLKAKKIITKLLNDDEAKHSLSKKFLHQTAE